MNAGHAPSGLPNLYFGAISHEELRQHSNYLALAPLGTVPPSDLHSCRYVRQDDALWGQLHPGVLTTGWLPNALGFLEPRAAKIVCCAKQSNHSALQSAYKHLRLPVADILQHAATDHAAVSNAAPYGQVYDGGGGGGSSTSSRSHTAGSMAVWQHNHPGVGQSASQHAPVQSAAVDHQDAGARRRQQCQAAASGGPLGVAQRWGVVQEAASLHDLMQLFDHSMVEEAGLHLLQLQDLPPTWGFPAHSLPLMGASPDATICHIIPLDTPAARRLALQLQCAVQRAAHPPQQAQQEQEQSPMQEMHARQEAERRGPSSSAQATADDAVLGLLREALALAAPRYSCTDSISSSDAEHSNGEGSSGDASLCNSEDESGCQGSAVEHASDTNAASKQDDFSQQESLAACHAGATTLAAPMQCLHIDSNTATSRNGSSATQGSGSKCTTDKDITVNEHSSQLDPGASESTRCVLCQQEHCCQVVDMPSDWPPLESLSSSQLYGALIHQAPLQGAVSVRSLGTHCWLMLREAVEVKNSCPFQVHALAGRRTKKGKRPRVAWVFNDRGPRAPAPRWVPQLQLHMLATGCWSVLVVCRSASRGLRLYRMYRNSAYLQLMLTYVRQLYENHVLKGVPPPKDAFFSEGSYRHLLGLTAALARRAELVAGTEGRETAHHPHADLRRFLPTA